MRGGEDISSLSYFHRYCYRYTFMVVIVEPSNQLDFHSSVRVIHT